VGSNNFQPKEYPHQLWFPSFHGSTPSLDKRCLEKLPASFMKFRMKLNVKDAIIAKL
jgi:hypothetical protein